jgi:hypothetical protein
MRKCAGKAHIHIQGRSYHANDMHRSMQAFASQQQSPPCGATSHHRRLFYVSMSTNKKKQEKQKGKTLTNIPIELSVRSVQTVARKSLHLLLPPLISSPTSTMPSWRPGPNSAPRNVVVLSASSPKERPLETHPTPRDNCLHNNGRHRKMRPAEDGPWIPFFFVGYM